MIDVLELGSRDVPRVAVYPLCVVPVDPSQGGEFDVLNGVPRPLTWSVDQLSLIEAVHAFRESVDAPGAGCPQGVRRVSAEHHYSGLSETIANQMTVADQRLKNPVFIDETPCLRPFPMVGTTGIEPVTSAV